MKSLEVKWELTAWQVMNLIFKVVAVIFFAGVAVLYTKTSFDAIESRLNKLENETFKSFSESIAIRIDEANRHIISLIEQLKNDNIRRAAFEKTFIDVINYSLLYANPKLNPDVKDDLFKRIKRKLEKLEGKI